MTRPGEGDFRRAGLEFECCAACHEEGDTGEHVEWIQSPDGRSESWPVCCRCAYAYGLRSRAERQALWTRAAGPADGPADDGHRG